MTERAAREPLYTVALTRDGARLAARLAEVFPGTRALAPVRFAAEFAGVEGFREPVGQLMKRLWPGAGGFLLVMAAGIVVRSVAPLLTDKATDPAVVVLDGGGRFAVPILSGHLGGANDLAREVGRRLGATPVITTATDTAGRPAVEMFAQENDLKLEDRAGVIRVNAAWASGEPVAAYADPAPAGAARSLLASLEPHLDFLTEDDAEASSYMGTLLALTHRLTPSLNASLTLRPPWLALGIGCRRDAAPGAVEEGVRRALAQADLAALSVGVVASVDAKKDEPALQALARSFGVPFRTFRADTLARVLVPTPSARVLEAVGTASVSEAAAMAATGGPLILPKVKGSVWTLAVALGPLPNIAGEGSPLRRNAMV